jgi:hypothetical protein
LTGIEVCEETTVAIQYEGIVACHLKASSGVCFEKGVVPFGKSGPSGSGPQS